MPKRTPLPVRDAEAVLDPRRSFAYGEFGYVPSVGPRLLEALERLRILLDDDYAEQGTLKGRTIAALMGAHQRAVHRNVEDTSDGTTGSRIDVGTAEGPMLLLQATGTEIAPQNDVLSPRMGMRRLYDAVVPSILEGPVMRIPPHIKDMRRRCALLVLDTILESGAEWSDWNDLCITLPSPLSRLRVEFTRPGMGVRTITGIREDAFGPDHPANRMRGGMMLTCHMPLQGEIKAYMTPETITFKGEELHRIGTIEKLRLLAEFDGLPA